MMGDWWAGGCAVEDVGVVDVARGGCSNRTGTLVQTQMIFFLLRQVDPASLELTV